MPVIQFIFSSSVEAHLLWKCCLISVSPCLTNVSYIMISYCCKCLCSHKPWIAWDVLHVMSNVTGITGNLCNKCPKQQVEQNSSCSDYFNAISGFTSNSRAPGGPVTFWWPMWGQRLPKLLKLSKLQNVTFCPKCVKTVKKCAKPKNHQNSTFRVSQQISCQGVCQSVLWVPECSVSVAGDST